MKKAAEESGRGRAVHCQLTTPNGKCQAKSGGEAKENEGVGDSEGLVGDSEGLVGDSEGLVPSSVMEKRGVVNLGISGIGMNEGPRLEALEISH